MVTPREVEHAATEVVAVGHSDGRELEGHGVVEVEPEVEPMGVLRSKGAIFKCSLRVAFE